MERRCHSVCKQAGAMLVEALIGTIVVTVTLVAIIQVSVQHSRLRVLDGEIGLAFDACRSVLEDLRTQDFGSIPGLHASNFDVPSATGAPGGLRALPDDPDGLPGRITVSVDQALGGQTLYRVKAEAIWTGVRGRQQFEIETLIAERK